MTGKELQRAVRSAVADEMGRRIPQAQIDEALAAHQGVADMDLRKLLKGKRDAFRQSGGTAAESAEMEQITIALAARHAIHQEGSMTVHQKTVTLETVWEVDECAEMTAGKSYLLLKSYYYNGEGWCKVKDADTGKVYEVPDVFFRHG